MSCDVAALPFQAHSNYGTWSIDFGHNSDLYEAKFLLSKAKKGL
jgi:hypothetical protein